jgi:PAS domain S-box-containing protein
MLVVFKSRPKEKKPGETVPLPTNVPAQEKDGRIRALEQELQSTREYLQTTNEELQSTNEELDTSREELQSTNEELRTINAEHQQKIDEQSKAFDDLNNLLRATEVATLFLDRDLRIRRFTPAARQIFRLIERDVGRPLGDISTTLEYPALLTDVRRAIDTLTRLDKEVASVTGEWYHTQIVPYRTTADVIEGAVVTFIDISLAEAIVETVRQPLLILDQDLKVVSANPAFYRYFQVRPEETAGVRIYDLGSSQWDIPALRRLLEQIVPQNTRFEDFRCRRVSQDRGTDNAAQRPPDDAQGRGHRPHPPGLRGYHGTNKRMNKRNKKPAEESEDLRQQAERRLHLDTVAVEEMSETEVAVVVHELRVHQVELEMQNEELRKAQVELEQSRSKYAELFDFAPVGYLVFDANGLVVEANLTAAAMLGSDRSALVGQPFSPHVAPASRDTWRLHYSAVFKTGKGQQCEIEVANRDQGRLIVRLHSRPVLGEGNKVVQCRTAMLDVTVLVRAEQRLRDSERRFRTLAENSPDIIVRIDAELRIVYANRHVEDALGIPADEVVGHTLGELEARADLLETWTGAVQQVFRAAKAGQVEFHCESPAGLRYYSAAVAPEFEESRTVKTVLVTIRDITDRIQAEEKYTNVIRSLQDGFCILDAEGRYIEVNDACCRMLGRTCEELLHLQIFDVWEPHQQEEIALHLQKALQEGSDQFAMRHVRKDGSRLDCDITMQRLDGDRLFVFARDVTERRIAEEKRMEALQRLELVSEATSDGIWDVDLTTDTFWHNDAYLTAFGYAPDEAGISRQWWQEHLHPQDRPEATVAACRSPGRWSARYRFQHRMGPTPG